MKTKYQRKEEKLMDMKKYKWVSFVLCLAMIFSGFGGVAYAEIINPGPGTYVLLGDATPTPVMGSSQNRLTEAVYAWVGSDGDYYLAVQSTHVLDELMTIKYVNSTEYVESTDTHLYEVLECITIGALDNIAPTTALTKGDVGDARWTVYIFDNQFLPAGDYFFSTTGIGNGHDVDGRTLFISSNPSISLEKKTEQKSYSSSGEAVQYQLLITNTGNVTLSSIEAIDYFAAVDDFTPRTLAPLMTVEVTATYAITEDDIENLSFTNIASASGITLDGSEVTATDSVTIDYEPIVNDPPVAVADSYDATEDTALNVTASGVLNNDTDVENDTLSAIKVTDPSHGTLTLNADGSFTYTPDANYNGSDSFTYKANDGTADSNIATVSINIGTVNYPPVAVADSYDATEDTALNVTASGVLNNDTDVENDTLSAIKVTDPSHGTLTLNADGSFTYTPDANYNGSDSFTYKANDGTADSNIATVSINIGTVNDNGGGGGGGTTIIEEEVPLVLITDHIAYIQGYPENVVKPEGNVTREEVAAVFFRLLEPSYREDIRAAKSNFPDVGANRWSTKHIGTLVNGKIVEGYLDKTFKPGNPITRAELATIASRFDALEATTSSIFSDVKGHWAEKYINSAQEKGWVNGYPDGTFKPDQYITRAEFVTLVNNVLERRVKEENILPDARLFPDLLKGMWYYEAMEEAINGHLYIRLEDTYEEWTEIHNFDVEM